MATSAASTTAHARLAFDDILSDDGTQLRAWTNDPDGTLDGPTVVLCNGLGTSPYTWPALLDPDCGVRVVSLEPPRHRRLRAARSTRARSGSRSSSRTALSVMDHFGVDRAVLMGWSMGVNTMFELAVPPPRAGERPVRRGRGPG